MEKKNKLLIVNFICLLALAIVISFPMIFNSYSFGATDDEKAETAEAVEVEEVDEEDPDYEHSVSYQPLTREDREALIQKLDQNLTDSTCDIEYSSAEVPVYIKDGYEVFCVEKGGSIRGPSSIRPGDITGGNYHTAGSLPPPDQRDTPNYKCVGEADLNLTAAYSLSAQRGKWISQIWSSPHITDADWGILQDALWADDLNVMTSGKEEFRNKISNTTGYALWQEALKYQNFYNLMQARKGYNPEDKTNPEKVEPIVNQEDKTYIVGPFKVDYLKDYVDSVDGTRVNFGVISKISLVDQNDNEMDDVEIIMKDNKDDGYDFPNPNQKFYVKFSADKYPDARQVKVKVDFDYLENCTARYHKIEGYGDEIGYRLQSKTVHDHCYDWVDDDDDDDDDDDSEHKEYYDCEYYYYQAEVVGQYKAQNLMAIHLEDTGDLYHATRVMNHETLYLENNGDLYNLTMNIGGYAFLDNATGKAESANGLKDDEDIPLYHTIVTLYDEDGNLAELYNDDEDNLRTNPTMTDDNGYYEFGKLNSMKKYFVKFTYNGQLYTSTTYLNGEYDSVQDMVENGEYNSDLWEQTSKAYENEEARSAFNDQFAEIGSYPHCYHSTDSLDYGLDNNIVYQFEDLSDIYDEIDNYIYDYLGKYNEWPDLKDNVYENIIDNSSDPQVKNKLQFIEDSKIDAYTGVNGNDEETYYSYTGTEVDALAVASDMDLYPVYDKFALGDKKVTISKSYSSDQGTYPPIYPGQLQVNYGAIYRPTFDLALYKDVYNATTKINGKTETYYYDKRALLGKTFRFGLPIVNNAEPSNAEMQEQHLSNISTKSKPNYDEAVTRDSYTQYIRQEDINQSGKGNTASASYNLADDDKLDVYIKYKVAIKNQASTIGAVTELVDYYDSNFTPYEAYVGDAKGNNLGLAAIETSSMSKYGAEIDPISGYDPIYLTIPDSESVRIADGETLFVYITLRMNNTSNFLESQGLLTGGTYDTYNYVEINGYRSYENKDGDETPGLIDIDSIAGNFDMSIYKPGETLLEDDEDAAPAVIFTTYDERTMDGNVFEDTVTSLDSNDNKVYTGKYRSADGKLIDDISVAGVRVELVEIKNGNMEVRAYTYTDDKGYYKFDSFIPGEYVIRYVYGEEDKTALTTNNKNYSGLNAKSYNGQDFQSTIAKNRGNEAATYNDSTFGTQTVVNTYGDAPYYWFGQDEERNSDATDITKRRQEVNNYSTVIKNHIAEVLNSYKDSQVNRDLVNELEQNTYMIALTPEMTIEPEYMKQELVYDGADQNTGYYVYKVENVDFGVVERPRAELSVKKVVDKVSLTAADGTVLANGYIDNNKVVVTEGSLKWISNLITLNNNGIVSIESDQELLHGATLAVTYKMIVTNNSEYDTYNGKQVTGKVNRIVDYVANNFTFDPSLNKGWTLVKADDLQLADGRNTFVNNNVDPEDSSRKAINLSIYQNIVVSNNDNEIYNKELKPGESVETEMVLKKLISTTEDDTDDFVYLNDIEIVESSISNGRKDYYEVVGNYDPTDRLSKQGDLTWDNGPTRNPGNDTSQAEKVTITPPTGGKYSNAIYYLIGAVAIAIVTTIVVIVIKKNNKKNKEDK